MRNYIRRDQNESRVWKLNGRPILHILNAIRNKFCFNTSLDITSSDICPAQPNDRRSPSEIPEVFRSKSWMRKKGSYIRNTAKLLDIYTIVMRCVASLSFFYILMLFFYFLLNLDYVHIYCCSCFDLTTGAQKYVRDDFYLHCNV